MVQRRIAYALAVSLTCSAAPVWAGSAEDLKAEAAKNTAGFAGALKEELMSAMNKGGPVAAIGACNEKAPAIAAAKSVEGWQIGRTSMKLRNEKNAPDLWELATMAEFEARKAKGEPVDQLAKAEIVTQDGQKTFRFMKAIPTAGMCLNCHGKELKQDVQAKLGQLYPEDKARGFVEGDLRGAFTLSKKL